MIQNKNQPISAGRIAFIAASLAIIYGVAPSCNEKILNEGPDAFFGNRQEQLKAPAHAL